MVSNAISQILDTKRIIERKYFKMSSIVMELFYFFFRYISFENQIMGR
jgi:hypothetical protein